MCVAFIGHGWLPEVLGRAAAREVTPSPGGVRARQKNRQGARAPCELAAASPSGATGRVLDSQEGGAPLWTPRPLYGPPPSPFCTAQQQLAGRRPAGAPLLPVQAGPRDAPAGASSPPCSHLPRVTSLYAVISVGRDRRTSVLTRQMAWSSVENILPLQGGAVTRPSRDGRPPMRNVLPRWAMRLLARVHHTATAGGPRGHWARHRGRPMARGDPLCRPSCAGSGGHGKETEPSRVDVTAARVVAPSQAWNRPAGQPPPLYNTSRRRRPVAAVERHIAPCCATDSGLPRRAPTQSLPGPHPAQQQQRIHCIHSPPPLALHAAPPLHAPPASTPPPPPPTPDRAWDPPRACRRPPSTAAWRRCLQGRGPRWSPRGGRG